MQDRCILSWWFWAGYVEHRGAELAAIHCGDEFVLIGHDGPAPDVDERCAGFEPSEAGLIEEPCGVGRVRQNVHDRIAGPQELLQLVTSSKRSHPVFVDAAAGPGMDLVTCLLYTSPSPRDRTRYRMPSSA